MFRVLTRSKSAWTLVPAGLFLARVMLEATGRPWPGALIVAIGLSAALGGLALGSWLVRQRLFLWPALLLGVYALWPRRDPVVAGSVVTLAVLVWLLGRPRLTVPRRAETLADGALFLVALVVYVATAAPDVLPADFGEFQLVAALLGVAHPPGFPLYTLMGHLFIRVLPWGTPAYQLNLMSGALAAGTVVLVARATRLWARRLGASPLMALTSGLAAALALGTATTFWAQATIANVRIPAVFFAVLALYALARFVAAAKPREVDRALVILGLALGLGGGHYPPLAFICPLFIIYVLVNDPRLAVQPRRWWRPLLVGLVSFLLPLAYLPIRGAMAAPLAPEGLDTLPGFLHHFLARGFAGDMFAYANATDLPHRLALVPTLFLFQFNIVLLVAASLGLLMLLWRDWRLFVLLVGSLAVQTFVTITYRAPQTVEYLMPAYLPIAIAVGLLPSLFAKQRPPGRGRSPTEPQVRPLPCSSVVCSLALLAALFNGWAHAPSFIELAGDYTARQTAAPLLEQAPAGALVLADWRWATPLWYLQLVEGARPDVEVRYVYPVAGEEYWETWLRHVQEEKEAAPDRPLLLTHFYEFPGFTAEPWGPGFLVRSRPATEPAGYLEPVEVTFGDQVRLVGYDLASITASGTGWGRGQFQSGQTAEFTLAWESAGPLSAPPSFTLRLVDEDGRLWAQADRALDTGDVSGEVHFERLVLPLYPTLPPGRYRVTLGVYTITAEGFENLTTAGGETAATLTWLELQPRVRAPFTLRPQWVPFADGPTLVGVDYDRSVPDVLRVYLHWRGAGEGTGKVRLWAASGVEAVATLPPILAGAYQTVAVDLHGFAGGTLWLGLTGEDGRVRAPAGPWGWPMQGVRLPTPAPNTLFVPLGDEMAVIGATAQSVAPGETMAVDVRLVALRPLTSDNATSVRLMDGEGRWLATHDCQPALSAIPTLKWIRGSQVMDRHLLPLPEDVTVGEVQATLVAYERFRMTPLPPMDGRFSEVPLGTWKSEISGPP